MAMFKSGKKVTKIKLTIMPKPHAHLQIMTKRPAKVQIDLFKIVRGVVHTRYPLSSNACRKSGITSQGEPRRKNEKIRIRLFFMLMLYITFQDPSALTIPESIQV